MQAIRYVIPSLMEAGRFVPGMTRAFVPVTRSAINAARSSLRPAWEYASRNEMREASRLADLRQSASRGVVDRVVDYFDQNFFKSYGLVGGVAGASWLVGGKRGSDYLPPGNGASIKRKSNSGEPRDIGIESRARPPGSGIYEPVNSGSQVVRGRGKVRTHIKRYKRGYFD